MAVQDCQSWSQSMLLIAPGAPQHFSEASQKRLAALLCREYVPGLFLGETASRCTEQIEPGTGKAERMWSIFKTKHPVLTLNYVSHQNRQKKRKQLILCSLLTQGKSTKIKEKLTNQWNLSKSRKLGRQNSQLLKRSEWVMKLCGGSNSFGQWNQAVRHTGFSGKFMVMPNNGSIYEPGSQSKGLVCRI